MTRYFITKEIIAELRTKTKTDFFDSEHEATKFAKRLYEEEFEDVEVVRGIYADSKKPCWIVYHSKNY